MKEFKIILKTVETISIQAESAEAALDQVKKQLDPRVLGGPIEINIVEEIEQNDGSVTS